MFIVQKNHLATLFKVSFLVCFAAILMALYYQAYMEAKACVICIQIRAIVVFIGLISAVSFLITKKLYLRWLLFIPYFIATSFGAYKSYTGYKVENGDIVSGCTMNPGFPSYLRLDEIVPYIFRPEGLCGESLFMFGGVTMMMVSMVMFSALIVASVLALALEVVAKYQIKENRP